MQAVFYDGTESDLIQMPDGEAEYKAFCEKMLADEEVAFVKIQRIIPAGAWRRRHSKRSKRRDKRYF